MFLKWLNKKDDLVMDVYSKIRLLTVGLMNAEQAKIVYLLEFCWTLINLNKFGTGVGQVSVKN